MTTTDAGSKTPRGSADTRYMNTDASLIVDLTYFLRSKDQKHRGSPGHTAAHHADHRVHTSHRQASGGWAIQADVAQTNLNAASARMPRVSNGIMSGV